MPSKTKAQSARAAAQPRRDEGTARDVDATRIETDVLYETKNDLAASTRAEVIALLNARLADCIDLQTHCKQAHWNVKGRQFIALHKLFDEINEAVEEYVDMIAERAVQLGGIAEGTARIVAGRTTLPEYPARLHTGELHVAALSDSLSIFARATRLGIEEMSELEDDVSADMLTEVTRGIDQWLWFVEAHQQTEEPKPVEAAR